MCARAWLQLAAELVGPGGLVIGVDLKPVKVELPEYVHSIVADIRELDIAQLLDLAGRRFDVVMTDLAADTTGIRSVDQARTAQLIEDAFALAAKVLKSGGAFASKIFDGPDVKPFVKRLEGQFAKVQILRPQATRSQSKEIYLVAKSFRPAIRESKESTT